MYVRTAAYKYLEVLEYLQSWSRTPTFAIGREVQALVLHQAIALTKLDPSIQPLLCGTCFQGTKFPSASNKMRVFVFLIAE